MKRVLSLIVVGWFLAGVASAQDFVICRLRSTASPDVIAARYGIVYVDQTAGHPFYLYAAPSPEYAEAAEEAMEDDDDVVWVEEDSALNTPETQAISKGLKKGSTLPAVGGRDTLYAQNTNLLQQVGFSPELANSPGRTVKVAVLDTGLTPAMTYLWDKVVASTNFVEEDQPAYDVPMECDSDGDGVVDSGTGHGSMVAGLLDQFAPLTKFVVVRVSDSDGNATVWTLIKGLVYSVDQGCEVANISFGTRRRLKALGYVVDWCENNGLLVFAPVGNNGRNTMCYPAAFDGVVSVAGLLPDNTKAPFSNYNDKCDFSAPATGIASSWWDGDWATWSGTSLASPIVAGMVADTLRRLPYRWTPEKIHGKFRGCGLSLYSYNSRYKDDLGTLAYHTLIDLSLRDDAAP